MTKYTADSKILTKFSGHPTPFSSLYVKDVARMYPTCNGEINLSPLHSDRRLQALRKAGVIRSTTKGWVRLIDDNRNLKQRVVTASNFSNWRRWHHWQQHIGCFRLALAAMSSKPVVADQVSMLRCLELIGSFEATDIDSDTVDLRFEIAESTLALAYPLLNMPHAVPLLSACDLHLIELPDGYVREALRTRKPRMNWHEASYS